MPAAADMGRNNPQIAAAEPLAAAAGDRRVEVRDVLDQAHRLMLQQNLPQAGLELIATLFPIEQKYGRAQILRLTALGLLGGGPEFDSLLLDLVARPKLLPHARQACFRLLNHGRLPVTHGTYRLLWGPKVDDIQTALKNLGPSDMNEAALSGLVETVLAAKGEIADRDAYLGRIGLGLQRSCYLNYLITRPNPSDQIDLAPLQAQFNGLFVRPDMSHLADLLSEGGSIVVLQGHCGVRGIVSRALHDLEVPLSLLGNGSRRTVRPGDFHINTSEADLPLRFTKLCQLMRKGARAVRIFPDGLLGGSFAESTIAGRRVKIALGAAALAFYGKSTFVFAKTRWTDDGITADFTLGPKVEPADTKESSEKKLIRFYTHSITELLRGDPIDFGPIGGYWPDFIGARKQ